jgi:hypothetical protein
MLETLEGTGEERLLREERRLVKRGWLVVFALTLFLFAYGFFLFFTIGDKGPPSWDFGSIPDIPGESVYSTNPPYRGTLTSPEPQHVSQKPPQAEIDASKGR